jgi:dolichol-phosphate mannosyltransferase
MKLSVVIPAHNEEGNIRSTVEGIYRELVAKKIEHEIVVVNDNSSDGTEKILLAMQQSIPTLRYGNNTPPNGYGFAVRFGLEMIQGDCVAVMMADASDSPGDLVRYYHKLCEGYEAVFGSRFMSGGKALDYPVHKLILNRMANNFIRMLFGIRYNDVTNAFKMYRTETLEGLKPYLSHHYNLTVELPLKVIVRGYSYTVISNTWENRKHGTSKLKIKEMGSRYLFIVLYCLIEKWLSRGDYHK